MRLTNILRLTLLSGSIILSTPLWAQREARGTGEHRTSQRSAGTPTQRTSSSASFSTPQVKRENATSAARPGSYSRPGASSSTGSTRPASNTSTARPASTSTRPSSSMTRPENVGTTRPAASGSYTRPTTSTRPSGSSTRPSGSTPTTRPSGTTVRPGGGSSTNNRPTGTQPQPGGNHNNFRPGTNLGHNPGHNHGTSVGRPGGFTPANRPHYSYRNPGYRPPRPGGGYWRAPVFTNYSINYWLPPRPAAPAYWRPGVPTLGTVLGLTFGSFIDAGINALYNSGYSIAGYINNAIYLNNVRQLGYLWPEVIVNYDDGLMSGTQFSYWTAAPDPLRYNMVYQQLVNTYGMPVSDGMVNGMRTATWWAGQGTGYVTLQYGLAPSINGLSSYYTTLSYNAVY